ncbi:MAG: hypothetical protein R3E97_24105 [Candidatus Eisenbacteria bacterium]
MNGIISLQSEMLSAHEIQSAADFSNRRKEIEQASQEAKLEFERLSAAGQVPAEHIEAYGQAQERAERSLNRMLETNEKHMTAAKEFDEFSAEYVGLGKLLEEVGDSAVEEVESDPHRSYTWTAVSRRSGKRQTAAWRPTSASSSSSITSPGFATESTSRVSGSRS